MNYLMKIWSPKIMATSLASNLCMNYYKYNIDGTITGPLIVEGCTKNNHIYSFSSRTHHSNDVFIMESIITSVILGGLSIPYIANDLYQNHKKIREYEQIKSTRNSYSDNDSCICGKL